MLSLIVKALKEILLKGEGGELCLKKYNLGVFDNKEVCLSGDKTWSAKNYGDLCLEFPVDGNFKANSNLETYSESSSMFEQPILWRNELAATICLCLRAP